MILPAQGTTVAVSEHIVILYIY